MTSLLLLPFVEEILAARTEVDDLWTTIPVIFEPSAFEAIESVADSFLAADETLVAIVSIGAFVACAD